MQRKVRRIALILLLAFIAGSAVLHFTVGSTFTALFPTWRYAAAPDQAISIISLSHLMRQQRIERPTPPPSPPPHVVKRTATHLGIMKYRELGSGELSMASIRPPARHTAKLVVPGPGLAKPGRVDAPVVTSTEAPTPAPARVASAKVDTGGSADELNGNIVWGDDNPPRMLRLAPVASTTTPDHPVRLEVEVGPDGDVLNVKLLQSSGDSAFDELVMDAVRKTTFAPATVNGLPVHGTTIIEFPPAATRST